MFKKTISICLALILALSLTACADEPTPETTMEPETTPTEPVIEETEASVPEVDETTVPATEPPEMEAPTDATEETEATKSKNEPEIPAGCNHTYKSETVTPTCTSGGYTTKTCTKCGNVLKTDEKAKLGHDYKEAVYNPATCGMDGSHYYHCTREGCLADYSVKIPATGHNWSEWVVVSEPTAKYDGVEMRECVNKSCDMIQTRSIEKLPAET